MIALFAPGDAEAMTTYISVVVHVVDVNEFAPVFASQNSFAVSVDTPLGSTIGRVSAFDPDFYGDWGRGISYSITPGRHADYFSIDTKTGVLRLDKHLWPMQAPTSVYWPPTYYINVAAQDLGGRVSHTVVTVSLNPGPGAVFAPLPRFRQSIFTANVTENIPAGHIITSLRDYIEGDVAIPMSFRLLNWNEKFTVSTMSGLLATLVPLDREVQDLYRLKVQVSGVDGMPAKLPQTATIEVFVLDVNDHPPRLDSHWMAGVIFESALPMVPVQTEGGRKALTIRPVDPDLGPAGQPSFKFVGPAADLHDEVFGIDPNTGILHLKGKLDRETVPEYLLTIEVADQGEPISLTSDALLRVRVRILDVNDSPPQFIDFNPVVANVFLPQYEGAEVARFYAVDPDLNDLITYHIGGGNGNGFFSIDTSTGVLRVSSQLAALTSVTQRQFLLQIEAKDNGSVHTATHNLSVLIHPTHLSKRLIIEPTGGLNISLIEHFSNHGLQQYLGQVYVRNALPGEIFRFELANASTRAFSIDHFTGAVYATGDVSASAELDREVSPVITLRVLVRDHIFVSGPSHPRLGEGIVNIQLEDINDHAPVFVGQPYHAIFCVKENLERHDQAKLPDRAPPHYLSLLRQACQSNYFKVQATDADSGRNGEVSYRIISIEPRTEPPLLSIDPISGRLSLIRSVPPDWAGKRLSAIVRAIDGGQKFTDALVEVELSGRRGPRFASPHYKAFVSESAEIGESVTSVTAHSASGSTLLYRLVSVEAGALKSGVTDSPFVLEYDTGVIRVGAVLDYEKTTHYNLLVEALDTTTGGSARVNVYVNVTDVNDERPVFPVPVYKAVVSESEDVGTIIPLHPSFLATDADPGVNGQLRYYLRPLADFEAVIGPNSSVPGLGIDPLSGAIRISEKLDFEQQRSLTFWIVAVDGGSPPLFGRSIVEAGLIAALSISCVCIHEVKLIVCLLHLLIAITINVFITELLEALCPLFCVDALCAMYCILPVPLHHLLTILDANDNPPRFDLDPDSTQVSEFACRREVTITAIAPTDSFVLQLLASDVDVNDTLTYRVLPSSDEMFHIDSMNGSVYWRPPQTPDGQNRLAKALLAFEAGNRGDGAGLSFEVEVSDGIHLATCKVDVNVSPDNWNAPHFPPVGGGGGRRVEVSEALPVGSHIVQIGPALDADIGRFGEITYTLLNNANHTFKLDPKTGDLTLVAPLDRETTDFYALTIMASDLGGLSDFTTLDVVVTDANDNAPVMEQIRYEPSSLDTKDVTWLDYSVMRLCFVVEAKYLQHCRRCALEFSLCQGCPEPRLCPGKMKHCGMRELWGFAKKSLPPHPILRLAPMSRKGNFFFTCALISPHILPSVRLRKSLEDRQMCDQPKACLQALKSGASALTFLLPPTPSWPTREQLARQFCGITFSPSEYSGNRWMTFVPAGELRLPLRISAHDADTGANSRITYRLLTQHTNSTAFPFAIDSQSGDILLTKPLTPGTGDFGFFVEACDQPEGARPLCSEPVGVTIYMADVELPWKVAASCSAVSVTEATYDLDEPVARCQLTNGSSVAGTWSLLGARDSLSSFIIDPQTGVIHATRQLDYEAQPSHDLVVQYRVSPSDTDLRAPLIAVSRVSIEVEDVNDCSPVLQSDLKSRIRVPENLPPGKRVYRFVAHDCDAADKGLLSYSLRQKSGFISDPSFIPFSIDSDGWVMVTGSIDREATPLYELTVTVSDTFDHTSVVFLTIEVFDLNDTPPEWQARGEIAEDSPSSEIHVLENQVPNQPVFTFPIKDSDSRSDSALMKFYQVGGSVQQFAISTTGKVYVRTPLDAESSESYVLLVKAFDGVHATSRPFELKILVDDINDNSPVCHVPDRETEVLESAPPGTVLFRLNATDADVLDEHSVLTYHLSERQDDVAVFNVDANSGVVTLAWKLDYETKKSYFLKVDARDKDSQFCHYNLHVYVLDVNDNAPVFEQPITITPVPEDAPVGSLIGKVHATDADSVDANGLEYSLATPTNANFSVDKSSGLLRVAQPLDRETLAVHELVVVVADGGALQPRRHPSHRPHRRHTATASVTIRLVDVNDSPPQFTEPRPHASVSELTPVGSLVMQLTAISLDEGENAVVRYRLLEDQPEFTLNSTTDALTADTRSWWGRTQPVFRSVGVSGSMTAASSTNDLNIYRSDLNGTHSERLGTAPSQPRPCFAFTNLGLPTKYARQQTLPLRAHIYRRYLVEPPNDQLDPHCVRRFHCPGEDIGCSDMGELYLTSALDYEHTPRFFLTIEAKDGGSPPLSSTTIATINVIDVNDNRPYFIGQDSLPLADNHTASTDSHVGLFTFEAYENSPVGTQIGRASGHYRNTASCSRPSCARVYITAGDADSGVNGRLSYAFCDPNRQPDVVFTYPSAPQPPAVSRLFRIGESKGELSFLFTPDREEVSEYRFAVCVSDHGDPVQSAMTEVRVIIRDTNDCQPHFERGNFEVYVQDLRNISQLNADEVLLSHLAVTDLDTFPNAGPFRCELSGFVVSPTALRDSSAPLFSVRSNPTLPSNDTTAPPSFRGLEPHQTGFCSVYAARILPLGSKSLVVHVYDNGMTALQSTATLTVHVSRQSNLPPEIVSSNSTLVVFRNITGSSLGPRFDLGHSMTSTKSQKLHDVPVMRVTVRDRTAYDQLFFELLEPAAPQFVIDQYDGSIRLRPRLEPGRSVTAPPPQSDPSVSWLEPALPKLPPAAQVNSGDYRLQVKVTNGSLSTNDTMFVKVITVTEEMLESACVLHVSELSPNELFILHLDTVIKEELARSLLLDPSARDASLNSNVYIISAQQSSMFLRREKRSVGGGGGGGVDLLIAVYDPLERSFIEPGHLVQSIHAMQANLSRIVGHQVHAFNSLCAQKKCESGSCVTRVILDAQSEPNVFEVHGVSHVSPRFALLATCRCPANFAGGACDRPLSVCASVACRAPRVCVASPTAPGVHACVCPPPLTGANCEVLNRPSADPKACFSETCFQQRENGPLQFTGGSFIHWQVAKPGEHKIEIAFSIRTRQQSGPLLSINWNVLRSLRIRLIENGNLAVSPVDFVSGVPTTDWLVSGTPRLNDGHWHRVRFTLFASASEQSDLQWWAELTIDGIHTYLENVDWAPGDTESQDVLFGAELVHGFRPLPEVFFPKDWVATTPDEPLDAAWPNFNYSAPPAVLRSGFVGCIRNVLIDRVKPPYQLGLTPQQTVLFSRQNHKPIAGVPDGQLPVGGVPALQVVRTLNLDYHCLARATYDGSCAYAPCRNGGTCVSHRALAFSQLGKGPAAVGPSDFNCTCQRDFQGPRCEVVTDPCALQPCRNGASCRSVGTRMPGQPTSYTCVCPPGFSGAHCDRSDAANGSSACAHAEALLSHQSPVCHHGARCQDAPSGPFCACPLGWRGGRCEHDLDECLLASEAFADDVGDNVSAQSANPLCNPYASHRGVCINLPGSYQCNCSLGYAGRNCQIRASFD
ncbi:unnamed protein product [Mesocestoides corti]|uniref:Uncharacterized protein n=1 Tax=Mesocestoides corti TaxID=53468 RepID=A0A3P6GL00_MESCO|nr:unnamed protein product [Mesocestoides corti]